MNYKLLYFMLCLAFNATASLTVLATAGDEEYSEYQTTTSDKKKYNNLVNRLYEELSNAVDTFGTEAIVGHKTNCSNATINLNSKYIEQYQSIIEKINNQEKMTKDKLLKDLGNNLENTQVSLIERLIKTAISITINTRNQIESLKENLYDYNNKNAINVTGSILATLNNIARCLEANLINLPYVENFLKKNAENKLVIELKNNATEVIQSLRNLIASLESTSLKKEQKDNIGTLILTIIQDLKRFSTYTLPENSRLKDVSTIRAFCSNVEKNLEKQKTQEVVDFNDIDKSFDKALLALPSDISEKLLEAIVTSKLEILGKQLNENTAFIKNVEKSLISAAGIPALTFTNNQLPKYIHLPEVQNQIQERIEDVVTLLNSFNEFLIDNLNLKNRSTLSLLQRKTDQIRPMITISSRLIKNLIISVVSDLISPLNNVNDKTTFEKTIINNKIEFVKKAAHTKTDIAFAKGLATQLQGALGTLILTFRETYLISQADAKKYITYMSKLLKD